MTRIYRENHLNLEAVVMESELIKVKVLGDLGFKMASIQYKPRAKEFLFQPSEGSYRMPTYGDDFHLYDTSGLDEMLPTIDSCLYPLGKYKGALLADHGDLWSLPWDLKIKEDSIEGRVELRSLPLALTKTIKILGDKTISMDYQLENLSDDHLYYLWALHGLNVFDEETELIFGKNMTDPINVMDDRDLKSFDIRKLSSYMDKSSYKYYFNQTDEKGEVGIDYKKDRLRYLIKYDGEKNPYMGVWITKGGFKGEYNCALEPSNGFYDSLDLAYNNKKVRGLKGRTLDRWKIEIEIKEY